LHAIFQFDPATRYETARAICPSVRRGATGMVFNADISAMVKFLHWGSQIAR